MTEAQDQGGEGERMSGRIVECKCREVHVSEFAPDAEYAVAILGLDPWKTDVSKCEVHRPKPAPKVFEEQSDGTFKPLEPGGAGVD